MDGPHLDDLELVYQPIYDLRTQQMASVEALVRWNHPCGEQVLPQVFLPQLLQPARQRETTQWIIATAARQLSKWRSRGLTSIRLAINLSFVELSDLSLAVEATRLVDAAGIPHDTLEFEISERDKIPEGSDALSTIHELRGQGFRIAIDDFGAGWASLRYTLDLPGTTIKMDRSIVSGVPSDRHETVLRHACRLALQLGFDIVIEGIETPAQLEVASLTCAHYAQGYYLSPPLSASLLELWM